jgi:DNA repair exonuclease SbcCD ATPase subunit
MQDIYIDVVKIKNVRVHSEMDMDFPMDNFSVIVGKMGTGKSTIFKSVSLAFFGDDGGKQGERLTISDVINKKIQKNLEIIVDFRVVENNVTDNYQIQLYYEHSKHKNSMFLFKNKIDISGATKSDTYKLIEKILVPRDVYHNTVYFTQQVKDFFTALTNSQQKEIFDSLLSLKRYDVYYNNTGNVVATINNDLDKLLIAVSTKLNSFQEKQESLATLQKIYDEGVKTNKERLLKLKNEKIEKENNLQILEDKKDQIDFNPAVLDELKGKVAILVSSNLQLEAQKDNELSQSQSRSQSELQLKISEIENKKNQEIKKSTDDLIVQKDDLQKELSSCQNKLTKVKDKYDLAKIERDHSEFTREKQKEIQIVQRDIQNLSEEYPTQKVEDDRLIESKRFDRIIQECKDKAEGVRLQASKIKADIDSKQKEIESDESGLNQEVPTCSKCLRPFGATDSQESIHQSIEKTKKEIQQLELTLSGFKNQMNQLRDEFADSHVEKNKVDAEYQEKIRNIIDKREQQKQILDRKIGLLYNEISDHEMTTRLKIQEMTGVIESETKQIQDEIEKIDLKLATVKYQISEVEQPIKEKWTKESQKITQEHNKMYIGQVSSIENIFASKKEQNEKEVSQIQEKILCLENSKAELEQLLSDIKEYYISISTVKTQISEIESYKPDGKEIENVKASIERIRDDLRVLEEKKAKILRTKTILDFWKLAFSDGGIKSMLIDVAIPYMNESISEFLEMVAPGTFTVSFDTLKTTKGGDIRDKFNVNVRHNLKGTDSHKTLSGGEKRLVDIGCMYALRVLSEKLYKKKFHNLFLDEALDALDDDCSSAFCQVMKVISKGNNVTLITHELAENTEPDRIFKF